MKLYISDNKVILTEGFDGVVPVKYFEKIETWPGRVCDYTVLVIILDFHYTVLVKSNIHCC